MLKTISILGYAGFLVGFSGLIVLRAVVSPSLWISSVQVAALLLFIWARVTFGRRSYHVAADPTEGGLVTGGPYRLIRHPIYLSYCVFVGAGVAAHWSWATAACGALVFAGAAMRIVCEESLVAARYPEYTQYSARTWCILPYVY